jgi:hypothetical protein
MLKLGDRKHERVLSTGGVAPLPVGDVLSRKAAFTRTSGFASPVGSLLMPPLSPRTACLQKHERQWESSISPVVAVPAAYWILKERQTFQVFHAETGETKTRRGAFGTRHSSSPLRYPGSGFQEESPNVILYHGSDGSQAGLCATVKA